MDKYEIIGFIKQNKSAEIAELQKRFNIDYKGAKEVINELLSAGNLVYAEGVRYNYVGKTETPQRMSSEEFERRRAEVIREVGFGGRKEPKRLPKRRTLRDYMRAKYGENKAEIDDDENDDGCLEEDEIDEDELRQKALKLFVEEGRVSVSMLQRAFPIDYSKACSLLDWMEYKGYISAAESELPWHRKVLITKEEYLNLYPDDWFEDDDDEEDEDDDEPLGIEDLFKSADRDNNHDKTAENSEWHKFAVQSLANVFKGIAENKKTPISANVIPQHDLWDNETDFTGAVLERMKLLIKSDKKMGQKGAVKKAETYLEAVRDTHDGKMVQVYERLVYEIKNTSNYLYAQLKKQLFED